MSDPIRTLVSLLSRLPGIGERTAARLVHHLLRQDRELMHAIANALVDVADKVHECPRCCTLTAVDGPCGTCQDARRDDATLVVVATVQDQAALEATGEVRGRYHVLHGTLSPLDGVGPEELRIQALLERFTTTDRGVKEIILATPPTIDGEATAIYLGRLLAPLGVHVSRIASGVPVGGELSSTDRVTLTRALASRRAL